MRQAYLYFAVTAFVVLFSVVYELNAHDVISMWMVLAALPFLIGGLCWLAIAKTGLMAAPCRPFQITFIMAVVSFTCGMVVRGVLEIYGTWNPLVRSFDVLFGLWMIAAVVSFLLYLHFRKKGSAAKRSPDGNTSSGSAR